MWCKRIFLPRLKIILQFLSIQVNQTRKHQYHIPPLIHDRTVAVGAADFARELVLDALLRWVVPFEVVVAVEEVDVFFVEDGGPLEGSSCVGRISVSHSHRASGGGGRTVLSLAGCAVTEHARQRCLSA